jgi:hypothetical protein
VRKVNKVENPNRQSLTHHRKPNETPNTTPNMTKKSQNNQLKRERTTVLLKSKIASLRIILLRKKSTARLIEKKATPKNRPKVNPWKEGKKATEDMPAMMHTEAIRTRDFLKEGRKNKDA